MTDVTSPYDAKKHPNLTKTKKQRGHKSGLQNQNIIGTVARFSDKAEISGQRLGDGRV